VSKSIEGWRHFFAAVTALATMPGSIVERVGHAYWEGLRKGADAELPAELRNEYARMMSRLETLYPTPHSRDAEPREAARMAKQILRLYDRMSRLT